MPELVEHGLVAVQPARGVVDPAVIVEVGAAHLAEGAVDARLVEPEQRTLMQVQMQVGHVFDGRAIGGGRQGGETVAVLVPVEAGDPRLADYVELPDPAARRRIEREELFVVEGVTAITRLLSSGHRIRSVLVTPQALARFDGELDGVDAPVYVADRDVLAATVGFDLHRGAVAVAERRPLPSVADAVAGASRIAVLEGLNDPENLGALARSARAFGIGAFVLDPTCIDPYYRRTIRVSMGEVLFLPVARAVVVARRAGDAGRPRLRDVGAHARP